MATDRIVLSCDVARPGPGGISVSAARLWPSPDYTRLTLEARGPIPFKYFTLQNPDRLVLDLEGVEVDANLNGLARLVQANDAYVKAVR